MVMAAAPRPAGKAKKIAERILGMLLFNKDCEWLKI
jgi:hypothetical protein